jgi:hypothetical protein
LVKGTLGLKEKVGFFFKRFGKGNFLGLKEKMGFFFKRFDRGKL